MQLTNGRQWIPPPGYTERGLPHPLKLVPTDDHVHFGYVLVALKKYFQKSDCWQSCKEVFSTESDEVPNASSCVCHRVDEDMDEVLMMHFFVMGASMMRGVRNRTEMAMTIKSP
ncbi:unnamed protein product, partial [Mesorhabditis belari]|uniref:Uncharacterized protein n=1 Tax=Mesorhabditis belari TaxID=2138241 RepID=A0AAF3FDE3_9BILA